MKAIERFLANEADSQAFAQALAGAMADTKAWEQGMVVHLLGDLGAGKSFLVRHLIQSFHTNQKVKSPTYTLVESYPLEFEREAFTVHHFDLYRMCDPEELEFLAIRDLLTPPFIALIEWPQKGAELTPTADIIIELVPQAAKSGNIGRQVRLQVQNEVGKKVLLALQQ